MDHVENQGWGAQTLVLIWTEYILQIYGCVILLLPQVREARLVLLIIWLLFHLKLGMAGVNNNPLSLMEISQKSIIRCLCVCARTHRKCYARFVKWVEPVSKREKKYIHPHTYNNIWKKRRKGKKKMKVVVTWAFLGIKKSSHR